jgi:hypothetical protein
MNTGVPPTPLNARTGELTPPGMSCRARWKAASELIVARGLSDMCGVSVNSLKVVDAS